MSGLRNRSRATAGSKSASRSTPRRHPTAARHLDGDIYEVRADGEDVIYRILFAPQGRFNQVLLALEGFKKKTQKTPPKTIKLAKRRLKDWERRGKEKKRAKAEAKAAKA